MEGRTVFFGMRAHTYAEFHVRTLLKSGSVRSAAALLEYCPVFFYLQGADERSLGKCCGRHPFGFAPAACTLDRETRSRMMISRPVSTDGIRI